MIIRNGIRSILRAKKLCLLFLILTGILSLVLSLGLSVYGTAAGTLASFRNTYRSVGRLEFIGSEYPDEKAFDPYAREAWNQLDPVLLEENEGVIFGEKKNFTLGYTEAFKRHRGEIPYKDYGILLLTGIHPLDEELIDIPLDEIPDFPDTYAVTDAVTHGVTLYSEGSVREIPALTYDRGSGTYTRIIFENGEYSQQSYNWDEVPAEAVFIFNDINGTRTEYRGLSKLNDRDLPRYVYDPRSGKYAEQIYKVSEYTAVFSDALYSRREQRKILIRLNTGSLEFEPEEKRQYAVHGSFIDGGTANLVFEVRQFPDGSDLPIMDVTGMEREDLLNTVFGQYADYYNNANNSLNVYSSRDVSLLEPFHQGWLSLEEGRFPEEYEDGVCVIDRSLASQLNLSPGSRLPLSFLTSASDDIYRIKDASEPKEYEIIGITADNNEYHGEVFISQKEPFDTEFFGCQTGYVLFDNEKARSASEMIRSSLYEGERITLYDQGYETNSQPLKALRTASLVVTLIASLAAAASLVLFAFLYIYRQKETIETLRSLGLSNGKTRIWMLSGVLLIVLAGSFFGCLAGALLQSLIISLTLKGTSGLYASDLRYSEAAAGLNKSAEIITPDPFSISLICILSILLGALILSLLFLELAMRNAGAVKGYRKISVPDMKTSTAGNGVIRYGMIGFERGGSRSAAVILICFTLSLLLCGFAAVDTKRHQELEDLYENTEITGSIVSLNGRYSTDLVISENLVRKFNRSGLLESFHVAYGRNRWWLDSEMPYFADTTFGAESREAWISKQARLIFTDSIDAAEDFFYTPASIRWSEGYDESFLSDDYSLLNTYFTLDKTTGERVMSEAIPALIPQNRLSEAISENGEITIVTESGTLRLKPAGIYNETVSKPGIYLPLSLFYDLRNLYEEPDESPSWLRPEMIFTAGRFRLNSAHQLTAFKDFLEQNRYSQVNAPSFDRSTVLIHDAAFLDTLSTLTRHLAFIQTVYPVLMVFTILIGFLISWLMINGRRMDFALMKGLGAQRSKVFMIFFTEQAYAALLGILPVLILSFFISKPVVIMLFAMSYLAGTALSIHLVSKENLMVLLSQKE